MAYHSLAARVPMLAVALVLTTTVSLTSLAWFATRAVAEEQARDRLTVVVADRTALLLEYVAHQRDLIGAVASRTVLREEILAWQEGRITVEAMRQGVERKLADAAAGTVGMEVLAVAGLDGTVFASTDPAWLGRDVSEEAAFLAGREVSNVSGPFLRDGAPRALVAAPLQSGERAFAVVLALVDTGGLAGALTSRTGLGATGEVRLAVREGDAIQFLLRAREGPERVPAESWRPAMRAADGFGRIERPDGAEILAAWLPVGYADWVLVVAQDAGEADAPMRALTADLALAGAVVSLAGALAAWLLARRYTVPLVELARAAAAVDPDREGTALPPPRGEDEIGDLGRALQRMVDRLAASHRALASHVATLEAAEAELTALNAELEARVHARTADLEASNAELEMFAFTAGHDLRAPLRAIRVFGELYLKDRGEDLDEATRVYVNRVLDADARMDRLILDLLALSRVTRAALRFEEIDLSRLVSAVLADLRADDPGRQVTCSVAPDLRVWADADLLRTLVENLLGNAWKYTAKRPLAEIGFGTRDVEGQRAFFVRDNGVGFDMRLVDHLFEPFQRLHSAREFPGTGVGLASVARVVRRHGGRVWGESVVGEGATFWFTLPDPRTTSLVGRPPGESPGSVVGGPGGAPPGSTPPRP